MRQVRKKKVEWKETNNYLFTPRYEYSLPVRNRYVFFWCKGTNYRKMLNYAENFVSPYSICCVYIFGDIGKQETFQAFLGKKRGNILALHLPGIQQDIETTELFSELLAKLQARGQRKVADEGKKKSQYSKKIVGRTYANEPSDAWFDEYQKVKKAVLDGYADHVDWMIRLQAEYDLWMVEYPAAMENICKALKRGYAAYGIYSGMINGTPDKHSVELERIARTVYPSGIEADSDRDFCYKMAAIKRLVQSAIKGEGADSLGIKLTEQSEIEGYQFSLFDSVTNGASEAVTFLREWCAHQLAVRGYFGVGEAWLIYSRPPFGAYQCNWYMWIFAYALRSYADEQYFYAVLLSSMRMRPEGFHYALYEPHIEQRRRIVGAGATVFVQNEEQNEFMRLIWKMFDIEKPWEETTQTAISQARSWITDNIHYVPLAVLDEKWEEILRYREDSYWFRFGYEKEYLPWLRDNFDHFYSEIRQLDAKLHERLVCEYGQVRADLYFKYSYIKGSAIGWLWGAEYMEEGIRNYMSVKDVCRECGRPLVYEQFKQAGYTTYVYDENHKSTELTFKEKDIIGLNKKLLGRYQEEYFCIPCLCEVLDCDAARLHEMLEGFKQDGCQLFT